MIVYGDGHVCHRHARDVHHDNSVNTYECRHERMNGSSIQAAEQSGRGRDQSGLIGTGGNERNERIYITNERRCPHTMAGGEAAR